MFGVGSPRCPRCNKPVYFNEEKLACGRKYHEVRMHAVCVYVYALIHM
jgi:hypothetical protein